MTPGEGLLLRYRGQEISLDPWRRSSIGTDMRCDVVLEEDDGGAPWATVRMLGGWCIKPLDGTEVALGNGAWGNRLTKLEGYEPIPVRLRRRGAEAELEAVCVPAGYSYPTQGFRGSGPMATQPAPAPPIPIPIPATLGVGEWLTIGREGGAADLQLPGPDVALLHARVRRLPNGSLEVRDLSHGLGVFVDGDAIFIGRIPPGGSFIIGHHRLQADPVNVTVETMRRSPVLECHDLTVTYRKKKPSLVDINFVLNTYEFMTVIGPSSAGKSTLFRALLGEVENVTGSVGFAGDALPESGMPRSLVSFLPQDDFLPKDLSVRQTIRFTAKLRLADLSTAELRQRADEVMERLSLTGHVSADVGALSGGTRKRVSLALELLSDPILLILDEPTSGLDEGLDLRLMQLLKSLARDGTAILLVTHSMVNLEESDLVLAINGKGATGYFGTPESMLSAFGARSHADVMESLRRGESAPGGYPVPPAVTTNWDSRPSRPPARRNQTPVLALRELCRFVPTSGGWRVLGKPAPYLLLAPLVVALISCLIGSRGLATTAASPNTQLTPVLSVLLITAAFFAAALTSGSIVSDYDMIKREERWGIRARGVIISRSLVFGLVALLQGILASLFFLILKPGPTDGGLMPGPLLMIVTISLLCLASAAAGLFVSALARTVQQGVFALMMLSVIQVVLSGLVTPLGSPGNAGVWILAGLSWATPIRWAAAALGSGIDLNSVPGMTPDGLWTHDLAHVAGAWAALLVLSAGLLAAAAAVLAFRLRRRL